MLVLGALLSGIGFGTGFLGSVGSLMPLAKPDERAGLLSAFYVQSYLSFSVPAILAGYLIRHLGYASTTDIYAAVIVLLNLLGVLRLRTRAAGAGAGDAPSPTAGPDATRTCPAG